jgi:hypothetical protein
MLQHVNQPLLQVLVWLKKSAASRYVAIVVVQEVTQALSTSDLAAVAPKLRLRCNQLVGEPLMRFCQLVDHPA